MVRIFTHKKRTYLGCDRHRVDFKITVDHINFTSNQYFLANSHYVIFRKQNKRKQFVSKNRVLHAKDLKMVHIDEKIKFRTCMFQDLTNRYLERYLPKNKRFVVRQVTAVTDEELYVNCGYFELPLDVFAMQPSGKEIEIEVPFVDPNGKAAGTVYLIIEHEPKTLANFLPNFSKSFQSLFSPKHTSKAPLPPSRLERNREKLDFVKQQQIENHWSYKYDGLSSDGECDDTHSDSESDLGSDAGQQDHSGTGNFNQSFIMNRTGMPQVSTKSLSSKNAYLSVHLDSTMFHFEDAGSDVPTPTNNRENAAFRERERDAGGSTSGSVTRIVSFDPQTIEAPSIDTISTLSQSERGNVSPRAIFTEPETKPESKVEPAPVSPHHIEIPHHVTAKQGNTHVPFVGQSYKVRAGAALQDDTEDEQSQSTTQPSEQASTTQQPPVQPQVEEIWEDVADFEKLEQREREQAEGGSYKPRKSLRAAPPPIISDSSQFIPARSVQRSASMTDVGMRENLPRYDPPPPVPQPPRKSLRGAPPPVVEKDSYIPAKVVHRVGSESSASMAQYMLNMDSVDEREQAARGHNSNVYIPPYVPKPTDRVEKKVERVERVERIEKSERKDRNVTSPSPAARRLVPVRLAAAPTVNTETGHSASLASHSLSPVASQSNAHQRHLPHRAQSTGDMYAGIGHRHAEHLEVTSPVSVKELRRKYEPSHQRPPMDREFSNGTAGTAGTSGSDSYAPYAPLSPKNLPKAMDGVINVRRTTSERSYSTLSTHTDLPKRHAQNGSSGSGTGAAKMLVPVRMQHPSEERAYNQYNNNNNNNYHNLEREQEISPLSTSTYNTTNTHRSQQGNGQGQSHHQLHRGVSQYTGERPYLSNHHSSGLSHHSSGSSSNALDFDLRQEQQQQQQHERYDRYHQQAQSHSQSQGRERDPSPRHHAHGQSQGQGQPTHARSGSSGRPLPVPVREQPPAPRQSHHHANTYQEQQLLQKYQGQGQSQHYQSGVPPPAPSSRGHHRSHSDVPHASSAPYPAHNSTTNTTHHLAPPIRLTASDYIPPQYERYVVEKHHTHVHVHGADKGSSGGASGGNGNGNGGAREGNGYYSAQQTRPAPPTAYRGVYA